jgi:hypothetical protein
MEEKMSPHEARAAELFLSGAVCAQAVFCAFCDIHGAYRVSTAQEYFERNKADGKKHRQGNTDHRTRT